MLLKIQLLTSITLLALDILGYIHNFIILADSRFTIRFKIIRCKILKQCLTILGFQTYKGLRIWYLLLFFNISTFKLKSIGIHLPICTGIFQLQNLFLYVNINKSNNYKNTQACKHVGHAIQQTRSQPRSSVCFLFVLLTSNTFRKLIYYYCFSPSVTCCM